MTSPDGRADRLVGAWVREPPRAGANPNNRLAELIAKEIRAAQREAWNDAIAAVERQRAIAPEESWAQIAILLVDIFRYRALGPADTKGGNRGTT